MFVYSNDPGVYCVLRVTHPSEFNLAVKLLCTTGPLTINIQWKLLLPAEARAVLFSSSSLFFFVSLDTITRELPHLAYEILHEHVPQRLEPYWISRSKVKVTWVFGMFFWSAWYTRAVLSLEQGFYLLYCCI